MGGATLLPAIELELLLFPLVPGIGLPSRSVACPPMEAAAAFASSMIPERVRSKAR
jgi:hypothetical protein